MYKVFKTQRIPPNWGQGTTSKSLTGRKEKTPRKVVTQNSLVIKMKDFLTDHLPPPALKNQVLIKTVIYNCQ